MITSLMDKKKKSDVKAKRGDVVAALGVAYHEEEERLALRKAAAWAWYLRGELPAAAGTGITTTTNSTQSQDSVSPSRRKRRELQVEPRPSRYKLEAMKKINSQPESEVGNSKSTKKFMAEIGTPRMIKSRLLDSYEIQCISKQLSYLLEEPNNKCFFIDKYDEEDRSLICSSRSEYEESAKKSIFLEDADGRFEADQKLEELDSWRWTVRMRLMNKITGGCRRAADHVVDDAHVLLNSTIHRRHHRHRQEDKNQEKDSKENLKTWTQFHSHES